jgi:hypothetical protein
MQPVLERDKTYGRSIDGLDVAGDSPVREVRINDPN